MTRHSHVSDYFLKFWSDSSNMLRRSLGNCLVGETPCIIAVGAVGGCLMHQLVQRAHAPLRRIAFSPPINHASNQPRTGRGLVSDSGTVQVQAKNNPPPPCSALGQTNQIYPLTFRRSMRRCSDWRLWRGGRITTSACHSDSDTVTSFIHDLNQWLRRGCAKV